MEAKDTKKHAHVEDGYGDQKEVCGPQLEVHASLHHLVQLVVAQHMVLVLSADTLAVHSALFLRRARGHEGRKEHDDHDAGKHDEDGAHGESRSVQGRLGSTEEKGLGVGDVQLAAASVCATSVWTTSFCSVITMFCKLNRC